MEWQKGNFLITDDKKAIDMDFVTAELNKTYWAEGRPREIVDKSIEHSAMFSLLDGGRMIGFARVVTDFCTFAWLCDVYIHPDFRGIGLGSWLVECVLSHPSTNVRVNMLSTKDSHGLYEKFGFERKECMIKKDRSKRPKKNQQAHTGE